MHSVTLRRRAPSQAGTAHTIEFPLPATPPQPTAPPTSLYQRCLQLMDRLAMVPGFSQFLEPSQPDSGASSTTLSDGSAGAEAKGDDTYLDPVKYLSTIFRNGLSLIALYNALKPEKPINYDPGSSMSQSNQDKLKIFLFLKAIKEIGLVKDGSNAPIVNDMLSDDTNAFMKVLDIVTLLLDELEKCGKLDHSIHQKPSLRFSDTDTKRPESNRERVVAEMLETERKYVSDLERLQKYMQEIQSRQILPEETVRLMFANLNSLLNFQRRFLIGVEANSRKISIEQQFGALFTKMEEGFSVYEPYVANHERAAEIAVREAPVLARLSNIIDPKFELQSLLIKPVQRICKYELLYKDMIKFSDKDAPNLDDLQDGYEATKRVAQRSNETRRREENYNALKDLEMRVEDWRKMDFSKFGELHLFDKFAMTTSDIVNELFLYLFDDSLICCKEVEPTKENRKSQKHQSQGTASYDPNNPEAAARKKKGTLQVRGRVHLYKMHRIVNTSRNGVLSLMFYWRDMVMEQFSLKFRTEEQLSQWKATVERLSKVAKEKEEYRRQAMANANAGPTVPSKTSGPGPAQPIATSRLEPSVSEYVMLHPTKASLVTGAVVPPTPTTPATPGFFMGGQFSSMGQSPGPYPYASPPFPGTPATGNPPSKLSQSHSFSYSTSGTHLPHHQLGLHTAGHSSMSAGATPNVMQSSFPSGNRPRKSSGLVDEVPLTNDYANGENGPPETYYYYRRGGPGASEAEDGLDALPTNFQRSAHIGTDSASGGMAPLRMSGPNGTRSVSAEMGFRQINTTSLSPPTTGAYTTYQDPPHTAGLALPSRARTPGPGPTAGMGSLGGPGPGNAPFRDRSGSTPNIFAQPAERPPRMANTASLQAARQYPPPSMGNQHAYLEHGPGMDMATTPDDSARITPRQSPSKAPLTVKNVALPRPPLISTQSHGAIPAGGTGSPSSQISPLDMANGGAHSTGFAGASQRLGPSAGGAPGGGYFALQAHSVHRTPSGSVSAVTPMEPLTMRGGPPADNSGYAYPPSSQGSSSLSPLPLDQSGHPLVKVKVNYRGDIFVLIVPSNIGYQALAERIERKIDTCTGRRGLGDPAKKAESNTHGEDRAATTKARPPPLKFTYQDEDGDFVSLNRDDDFQMALETSQKSPMLPGPNSRLMANASPGLDGHSPDPNTNLPSPNMWSVTIFAA